MKRRSSLTAPLFILLALAIMGVLAREFVRNFRPPPTATRVVAPVVRGAETAPATAPEPSSNFSPTTSPEMMKSEFAREHETRRNLRRIRDAVYHYRRTHRGQLPPDLSFIPNLPPVTATHDGIGNGTFESPAGSGVAVTTNDSITMMGTGWRYNPETGQVRVNSAATDSQGMAYSGY